MLFDAEVMVLYMFFNLAGDMDGHADGDVTPDGYTSFHYQENRVGQTGTFTC